MQLIVIGAGIVGLACARAAQKRGWQITLVDRAFEGDRASHGNAGGIAVSECIPLSLAGSGLIKPLQWLLDPLGPLAIRPAHAPRLLPWFLALRRVSRQENYRRIAEALAALNTRAMADIEKMMADIGLAAELHKNGALAVYESQAAFAADAHEWQLRRELGVRWRAVDAAEIRALEPGLAPVFAQGVLMQDSADVEDPRRIVEALRRRLIEGGATLESGEAIALDMSRQQPAALLADGRRLAADKLLVAAGAWSARLAKTVDERALLESERGYNTTLPASRGRIAREIIFAERKFVAAPLAPGLRIGGAAEFAGLEAPADYRRSAALLQLARRYLPDLDESGATQWMGHRPATPDSLPVISASKRSPHLFYAFGHGHLGLTQSATTGELVSQLIDGATPTVDMAPYSISRF